MLASETFLNHAFDHIIEWSESLVKDNKGRQEYKSKAGLRRKKILDVLTSSAQLEV